jgi:hypothetical protein
MKKEREKLPPNSSNNQLTVNKSLITDIRIAALAETISILLKDQYANGLKIQELKKIQEVAKSGLPHLCSKYGC